MKRKLLFTLIGMFSATVVYASACYRLGLGFCGDEMVGDPCSDRVECANGHFNDGAVVLDVGNKNICATAFLGESGRTGCGGYIDSCETTCGIVGAFCSGPQCSIYEPSAPFKRGLHAYLSGGNCDGTVPNPFE